MNPSASIFEHPAKIWSEQIATRSWADLRDIDLPFIIKNHKQGALERWLRLAYATHAKDLFRDTRSVCSIMEDALLERPWGYRRWSQVLKTLQKIPQVKDVYAYAADKNSLSLYDTECLHLLATWMNTPHLSQQWEKWEAYDNIVSKAKLLNAFSRINHPILKTIDDLLQEKKEKQKVTKQALLDRKTNFNRVYWYWQLSPMHQKEGVVPSYALFSQAMQQLNPYFCHQTTSIFCQAVLRAGHFHQSLAERVTSTIKKKLKNYVRLSPDVPIPPTILAHALDLFVLDNQKVFDARHWDTLEKTFAAILKSNPQVIEHAPVFQARLLKKSMLAQVTVPKSEAPTSKKKM